MLGRHAGEDHELHDPVEGRRIALFIGYEGPQKLRLVPEQAVLHLVLEDGHIVSVTLERIDLPVVAEDPEGLRQGPVRRGVRGEPLMKEAEGGFHVLIDQVRVELGEVGCDEHAFVYDGP